MGFQRVERVRKFLAFEYDATVDGGEAGAVTMRNLDEVNTLPADAIILSGFLKMTEDFVDTDEMEAATINVGITGTTNKYFATAQVAAASEGDLLALASGAVLSLAGSAGTPLVTIGGGGLDAGAFQVYLEYILPLA